MRPPLAARALLIALAVLIAGPAGAQAVLSIPLDLGPRAQVITDRYQCSDGTGLTVQYVNTPANHLALIRLDGAERIFVTTLSASGARYVSGTWEWWSKGNAATLRSLTRSAPERDCKTAPPAGG
ncbi:MliC family protein [Solirhodobacter olei]|uniref:MliC family protein n=1 Tax=Solirhodobacter olei TaxID=2493082 RepID=UPI000FDC0A89|nr:MliC family protein [Solirhodobacter olei]